jgi:uncharacterized protein YjgD (DUF1641 family)
MSETTAEAELGKDALADAIAENPEAVAEFVKRLDAVNELLDVVTLGTEALDDSMVAELTGTAATLGEAADGAATTETVKLAEAVGQSGGDLADALETVVELQRTGTLDDLVEAAHAISLLTEALDDEMVVELARTGSRLGEVADAASDPETVQGIQLLLGAMGQAGAPENRPDPGMLNLAKSARDPDVQAGLGYLLALAGGIGANLDTDA